MSEVFEVDPDSVIKESMYKEHVNIKYHSQRKNASLPSLKMPVMAEEAIADVVR